MRVCFMMLMMGSAGLGLDIESLTRVAVTAPIDNSDWFGQAAAVIGDLDGDGVSEIAVGALGDDDGGTGCGAIYILFMQTPTTVSRMTKISNIVGNFQGKLDEFDYFGKAIAPLGDLDGDGVPDIAVGAWWDDEQRSPGQASVSHQGAVWIIFLTQTGRVKALQKISSTQGNLGYQIPVNSGFGCAIANIGDLDGDGVIDLAVGACRTPTESHADVGAVLVLLLREDGTVKSVSVLDSDSLDLGSNMMFGASITLLGSVRDEHLTTIAVGSPRYERQGGVWLLDIDSSAQLNKFQTMTFNDSSLFTHTSPNAEFGWAVGAMGQHYIAVSSKQDSDTSAQVGAVWLVELVHTSEESRMVGARKVSRAEGSLPDLTFGDSFGVSLAFSGEDGSRHLYVGASGIDGDEARQMDRGALFVLGITSDSEQNHGPPHLVAGLIGAAVLGFIGLMILVTAISRRRGSNRLAMTRSRVESPGVEPARDLGSTPPGVSSHVPHNTPNIDHAHAADIQEKLRAASELSVHEEAVAVLKDACDMSDEFLPEAHPLRMRALLALANQHKAGGDYKEAMELFNYLMQLRGQGSGNSKKS